MIRPIAPPVRRPAGVVHDGIVHICGQGRGTLPAPGDRPAREIAAIVGTAAA